MTRKEILERYGHRHASVTNVLMNFAWAHLRGRLGEISSTCGLFAFGLADQLTDSPELVVALRKLLECKDAAVRCAVAEEL